MGRIIMVLYMEALLLSVLTIWFLYHIIKKEKNLSLGKCSIGHERFCKEK